jgi:hypothetical protein
VRDRRALEVHAEHLLARVLGRLFNRRRDLVGLAVTDADVALAVAGDDEGAEAESAATLDDLGAAVDADDGGLDAALFAVVASRPATATAAAPATATALAASTTTATAATATATAATAAGC